MRKNHTAAQKQQTRHIPRRCHRCRGSGNASCQICLGAGQIVTGRDIFGKTTTTACQGCFGRKFTRCSICNGEGFV